MRPLSNFGCRMLRHHQTRGRPLQYCERSNRTIEGIHLEEQGEDCEEKQQRNLVVLSGGLIRSKYDSAV